MNDRIKELADKAQEYAEWMTPQGLEWLDNFKEQFAKLIIEECATICDTIGKEARKEWKTKYIPHDDGRCDGAWQCEAAILEHFGVNDEAENNHL